MVAAMGKGSGKTPERVVEKINIEVEKIGQNGTARAIGIPLRSVQKYMAGIAEPSQATFEKMAIYFGVSVAWLRGGSVGPVERILEGLKICGTDPAAFNKTIADKMGEEGDCWRGLVTGKISSDWVEIMCDFFGINRHWIVTGEHPTLLTRGGIVGTETVDSGLSVAGLRLPDYYSRGFPIRRDPYVCEDSPPAAVDIVNWLRKNAGLRKEVEELLAAEDQRVSENDYDLIP